MQILGLSDSTAKPEGSRVKALLWPSIRHEYDADYVCQQGFWVCAVIAAIAFLSGLAAGSVLIGLIFAAYYFLGGIGVRESSRFAAIAVFLNYVFSLAAEGLGSLGVVSIITVGLLLANVRGTWLTARWRAGATEPPPLRLSQTIGDKISNQMPIRVWPLGKWLFYIMSVTLAALIAIGLIQHLI